MASALYKKKCYSKEKYLSEICYTTVKTGSMKSNIISEKKWYMTLFLFFSTHFDFSLTWPTTCFYYTWFYFIPARPVALMSLLRQMTWLAAGLSTPKVEPTIHTHTHRQLSPYGQTIDTSPRRANATTSCFSLRSSKKGDTNWVRLDHFCLQGIDQSVATAQVCGHWSGMWSVWSCQWSGMWSGQRSVWPLACVYHPGAESSKTYCMGGWLFSDLNPHVMGLGGFVCDMMIGWSGMLIYMHHTPLAIAQWFHNRALVRQWSVQWSLEVIGVSGWLS